MGRIGRAGRNGGLWGVRRAGARWWLLLCLALIVAPVGFLVTGIEEYLQGAQAAAIRQAVAADQTHPRVAVLSTGLAGDANAQTAATQALLTDVFAGAPIVISRTADVAAATVTFTIRPDGAVSTVGTASRLLMALTALPRRAHNDVAVNEGGVTVAGDLRDAADTAVRSAAAIEGVAPLPLLLILPFAITLLAQILSLLVASRADETSLFLSRGLGAPLAVVAFSEVVVVVAPAAIGGSVLAWALSPATSFASALWAPLGFTALAVAIVGFFLVRAGSARFSRVFAGRSAVLVAGGPAVLLVLAAVISGLRFRQLGSAVAVTDAGPVLDPIAAAAPTLTVLGAALLGSVVVGGALRGAAWLAAGRRGIAGALLSREMTRRWAAFGTATALIGVSVGGVALAASYAPTWNSFRVVSAQLRNSADVRVDEKYPSDLSPGMVDPAAKYRRLPAVESAAPVFSSPSQVGNGTVTVMAVPAGALAALPVAPGGFDPAAVQRAVSTADAAGIALPSAARRLVLPVIVTEADLPPTGASSAAGSGSAGSLPAGTSIEFVAWVGNPAGSVAAVRLGRVALTSAPGAATRVSADLHADLPVLPLPTGADRPGAGHWQLLAVDTVVDGSISPVVAGVEFSALRAETSSGERIPVRIDPGQQWTPRVFAGSGEPRTLTASAGGSIGWRGTVPASPGVDTIRSTPLGGTSAPPVPVAVNGALATRLGLSVGDRVQLPLFGTSQQIDGTVALVSPVLPGPAGESAVLDLAAAQRQLLVSGPTVPAPNQVWIGSPDPPAAKAAAQPVAGSDASLSAVTDSTDVALVRPASTALWMGAGACVVLMLIMTVTFAMTSARTRRAETVTLHGLGLTIRRVVAIRRGELLTTVLCGAAVGVLAGVVGVASTVRGLARSAVIDAPAITPQLLLAPAGWVLFAGAVAGGVAVAVAYGQGIRRQADTAAPARATGATRANR